MRRAASWLCERGLADGVIDLTRVLVLVSGSRAGRQLTASLIDKGAEREAPLLLPRIVTPDGLLNTVFTVGEREASEPERWWSWLVAFGRATEATKRAITAREIVSGDVQGGVRLAKMIDGAHRTLAGEGLRFADVARKLESNREAPRWAALAELELTFLADLDRAGLTDGGGERITRLARGRPRDVGDVVLVGVLELPGLARRTLHAMGETARVTAVVLAPTRVAPRFDELGCVRPEAWGEVDLELEAELSRDRFRMVQSPMDQADAALEAIESWNDLGTEDMLVGNLDDEVAAHLMSRGPMCGVELRRADGEELTRTRAYQLLVALEEYLTNWSFRGLGSLARHCDVSRWLAGRLGRADSSWLSALDEFGLRRLPLSTRELGEVPEDVRALVGQVDSLLGEMASAGGSDHRPISLWCGALERMLSSLGGIRDELPPREARQGYETVREVLSSLSVCRLAGTEPRCSSLGMVRLVRELASERRVPSEAKANAIELLGWLELVSDDSAGVVLTGFNEGHVPARSRDGLISDAVRRSLSLPTSDAHAARDQYVLAALAGSGRRLVVVCGRTSNEGDPLLPSRLMFSCSVGEIVRRVGVWTRVPAPPRRPGDAGVTTAPAGEYRILAPDPTPTPPASHAVERMSVTAFRDYLASPYLFYLRHVLRITEVSEAPGELDARGFGNLIHECLAVFGRDPVAVSVREAEIEAFLSAELDRVIVSQFGARMPVSVRVQREHARGRLHAFAQWQAKHVRDGWRIQHVEWEPGGTIDASEQETTPHPNATGAPNDPRSLHGVAFDVDGRAVRLLGRIDRIDRHADGRWLLLDYKTAPKRHSPDQMHLADRRGEPRWIDLQLPLYRRLAESMCGLDAGMGYVCLPTKPNETGLTASAWTSSQLASAEECARDVVRRVRRGEFFELGSNPPDAGVFGWLCGTGFIASTDDDDGGGDAEGSE